MIWTSGRADKRARGRTWSGDELSKDGGDVTFEDICALRTEKRGSDTRWVRQRSRCGNEEKRDGTGTRGELHLCDARFLFKPGVQVLVVGLARADEHAISTGGMARLRSEEGRKARERKRGGGEDTDLGRGELILADDLDCGGETGPREEGDTRADLPKTDAPATFLPEARSRALYTFENAPLDRGHRGVRSTGSMKKRRRTDALSHLDDELEALEALVLRDLVLRLALFLDDLFDLAGVLLGLVLGLGRGWLWSRCRFLRLLLLMVPVLMAGLCLVLSAVVGRLIGRRVCSGGGRRRRGQLCVLVIMALAMSDEIWKGTDG